jgi:Na+-driven multidrug efflux pump
MLNNIRKKFIGDRAFYSMVFMIVVPIIIQNGISNFVSLLDNIMVGSLGTEQMSSVSIVNQLLFVYNLCIFGGLAGAGIFTAQYFGQKDEEGVRQTVRFKLWIALNLTAGAFFGFLTN